MQISLTLGLTTKNFLRTNHSSLWPHGKLEQVEVKGEVKGEGQCWTQAC